eukprot:7383107-Prymnesium_polylepis.1
MTKAFKMLLQCRVGTTVLHQPHASKLVAGVPRAGLRLAMKANFSWSEGQLKVRDLNRMDGTLSIHAWRIHVGCRPDKNGAFRRKP